MDKENFKLVSQSEDDWNKLVLDEFYRLDIKANNSNFSGEIDIVKYEDDFRFANVNASCQEVISEVRDEYFYLITTQDPLCWRNGHSHGYLKSGGIVVFDCTQDMAYKFPGGRRSKSFLIPYQYFRNGMAIDAIRNGNKLTYQDIIYQLLGDIKVDKPDLINRLHSIANLLTITNPLSINESKIQQEYEAIERFIVDNAGNPNISLDYVANRLLVSRSKVQAILTEMGTNYTSLVKQIRVQNLAKSIEFDMTKNLYQLCFEHGYRSISSASSHFKSIKGVSLKQYRDSFRQ